MRAVGVGQSAQLVLVKALSWCWSKRSAGVSQGAQLVLVKAQLVLVKAQLVLVKALSWLVTAPSSCWFKALLALLRCHRSFDL
jgi:hypothetical protein